MEQNSTPSQKKIRHFYFSDNFGKSELIFMICHGYNQKGSAEAA